MKDRVDRRAKRERRCDYLVATPDPLNQAMLDEVAARTGREVVPVVCTEADLEDVLETLYRDEYLQRSTSELVVRTPEESASKVLSGNQKRCLSVAALLLLLLLWRLPAAAGVGFTALCSLFYLTFSLYRCQLIYRSLSHNLEVSISPDELAALDEASLPSYSILVPLYREASVLPILLTGLARLDYPTTKLDVKLLLEEDDRETLAAVAATPLPAYVHPVIVPAALPRGKPKACNYGLIHARGEYVVIYDAEDVPEADQLKKAVAAFRKVPPEVVCLQAKLNYYNANQNLLSSFLGGNAPNVVAFCAEDSGFVTKGADMEIIAARLRALLRVKAYQDQLRRMNAQIIRDLQIARRVQEALVPQGTFRGPRVEVRSAYIPSEALSGDFYDYFLLDDSMYLFVADVSGHGLPAAILVSLMKSYIHTESDPQTSLADFMSRLNDFLFTVSLPTQFATAQLFRVNESGALEYSNAAHPPFLLYQHARGKTVAIEDPSNLLGAMPHMAFEDRTLTMSPGDTLFVYTDGLTDRRNEAGEFYSIDRIASLLENSRDADLGAIYDSIYEDVNAFAATEDLRDDIAFVVTRFQ